MTLPLSSPFSYLVPSDSEQSSVNRQLDPFCSDLGLLLFLGCLLPDKNNFIFFHLEKTDNQQL